MLYDRIFDHFLVRIDPETAHAAAVRTLNLATAGARTRRVLSHQAFRPNVAVDALGHRFHSPLGVAAGVDKNATWFRALGAIGFGSVEVGTVTPVGQPGRERPRIRRMPADGALLNAMGFPNEGAVAVAARLRARAAPTGVAGVPVVGANLGKNLSTPVERAAEDYVAVARALAPLADYVALNVSSPNTPGLRALEAVSSLAPLVAAVQAELGAVPLLVKISPDLADEDVDAVADLAASAGLAGVIATNTTTDRGVLSAVSQAAVTDFSGGGVSGRPLGPRSLAVLRRLYARLKGTDAIVVSVGGVSNAEDVWQRILAGATLVQAYTGFIYGGPAWPAQVNRELSARVAAAGVESIGQLVGVGA